MKLWMASLMIAGMVFSTSCSSDDDGGSQTGGDLTARWNPDRTLIKVGNAQESNTPYPDNNPNCDKNYVEFTDDNNVRIVVYTRPFDVCEENINPTATTYTRNDLTLVIDGHETYDGTWDILKLTGSELRIRREVNSGGVNVRTTVHFKKAANQE